VCPAEQQDTEINCRRGRRDIGETKHRRQQCITYPSVSPPSPLYLPSISPAPLRHPSVTPAPLHPCTPAPLFPYSLFPADYSKLNSFGGKETIRSFLVPSGEGVSTKVIDEVVKGDSYLIEYVVSAPDAPVRHVQSVFALRSQESVIGWKWEWERLRALQWEWE
jgi:hypothetical protein